MNINLHIERLILDGVNIAPDQRHLLQASLTIELTKLLNQSGLAANFIEGLAIPKLTANGLQLTGNNPTQLGRQIAQSVYGGIGRE